MRLSEAIREIIRLGDASSAYWDTELHKRHPHYPIVGAGEVSPPPPPEDARIEAILRMLPDEQVYAILLFAYLGRGDFRANDLVSGYKFMKDTFPTRDIAIARLTTTIPLSEYLTDAMEELTERSVDVDHLSFESTAAVS